MAGERASRLWTVVAETVAAAGGGGVSGRGPWPGSTITSAIVDLTADPHVTHTHQAHVHTELIADTVNDVRPARHETTSSSVKEPVSHADIVSSLSLTCCVVSCSAIRPLAVP